MTVRNVKNLVQKLLRIPAMRQELLFMAEDPVYAGVMVRIYQYAYFLYLTGVESDDMIQLLLLTCFFSGGVFCVRDCICVCVCV